MASQSTETWLAEVEINLGTNILCIIVSHPIQHFIPWFRALADHKDIRVHVLYADRQGVDETLDREFGESFAWEMDLLAGYPYTFLRNPSRHTGVNEGFCGIQFKRLRAALKTLRPTAVLILGWQYLGYWQAAWTAKQLGIPYILRGESNLLNRGGSLKWWSKRQCIGRMCRGAEFCLAIGKRNADLYRAYGVSEERLRIAPYFVDNAWFAAEAKRLRPQRNQLREKFNLPKDSFVLLFMGKLIAKKHPDHLLKAWQGLPQEFQNRSALLLAGSGEMNHQLRQAAKGNPRIRFSGFLNRKQLPEAYAVSDALVLPSDHGETWGLVVNEALASGIPAIVSDQVGCALDLISPGKTGYMFRFADISDLTSVMIKVISSHPNKWSRISLEVQERASMKHSVTAVAQCLQHISHLRYKSE